MDELRPLCEVVEKPQAGYWGASERSGVASAAARVVRNGDAAGSRTISTVKLPLRWFNPNEVARASLQIDDTVLVSSGEVGFASRVVGLDADYPSIASNFVRRVRAADGYDPAWLAHLLQSAETKGIAERFSGGTAIQNLGSDFFKRYRVWVPPLEVQRRIAEILDTIDETIQATERVIAKLQLVQSGLIDQSFNPSLGTLTELGVVCSAPGQYGCVAPAEQRRAGWPRYVRITDVTDSGTLRAGSEVGVSPTVAQKAILRPGDIVFARSGATVGKTYLYDPADGLCAFAGYLIRFRPDPKKALPEFVRWWTHSSFYWRWVKGTMREGAQPNINAREYATAVLPLPSIREQRLIVASLVEVDVEITTERRCREKLRQLRSGLVADLLSGRIRTVAS
ncbi:MAG: restriction endonuclease subunit S [bacterium]|nr:restriction endonuclease subunit S [bacterium]